MNIEEDKEFIELNMFHCPYCNCYIGLDNGGNIEITSETLKGLLNIQIRSGRIICPECNTTIKIRR